MPSRLPLPSQLHFDLPRAKNATVRKPAHLKGHVGGEHREGPGAVRDLLPSPGTRFFEGGRVSQTLYGVSKTLFDST